MATKKMRNQLGEHMSIGLHVRQGVGALISATALAGLLLAAQASPALAMPVAGESAAPAARASFTPYVDRLSPSVAARPTSAERYASLKARQIEGTGFEVLPLPALANALSLSAQRREQADMRQAARTTHPKPVVAGVTAAQRYQAMKDAQLR